MAVDGDEGNKVEDQPGFLTQLQAILNVLPAYTWYAPPSGSLAFVSKRQADFLGVPEDHPLRFGVDIGAPRLQVILYVVGAARGPACAFARGLSRLMMSQ